MLKIRRSCNHLIFNMGIPIPGKDGVYIEMGLWRHSDGLQLVWLLHTNRLAIEQSLSWIMLNVKHVYICDYIKLRNWLGVCDIHHEDIIKWKHFPRYWPFVGGIHWSLVNSPYKGQWSGALMFSLICDWIYGWVNNGEACDLRRHHAHYDVTVMIAMEVVSMMTLWHANIFSLPVL